MGFSVPPMVVKEVEMIAKSERRTKSELFREMVRVYRGYREQRDRDELRWVTNLIKETKAEQARAPMTVADMLAESERLVRYGEKQAKKVGIKPNAANRIIHERRKALKS
jgi:metal-responsive CopG/Arc/MetJ family transcriptional regulator